MPAKGKKATRHAASANEKSGENASETPEAGVTDQEADIREQSPSTTVTNGAPNVTSSSQSTQQPQPTANDDTLLFCHYENDITQGKGSTQGGGDWQLSSVEEPGLGISSETLMVSNEEKFESCKVQNAADATEPGDAADVASSVTISACTKNTDGDGGYESELSIDGPPSQNGDGQARDEMCLSSSLPSLPPRPPLVQAQHMSPHEEQARLQENQLKLQETQQKHQIIEEHHTLIEEQLRRNASSQGQNSHAQRNSSVQLPPLPLGPPPRVESKHLSPGAAATTIPDASCNGRGEDEARQSMSWYMDEVDLVGPKPTATSAPDACDAVDPHSLVVSLVSSACSPA
jgi:hypothetical protein